MSSTSTRTRRHASDRTPSPLERAADTWRRMSRSPLGRAAAIEPLERRLLLASDYTLTSVGAKNVYENNNLVLEVWADGGANWSTSQDGDLIFSVDSAPAGITVTLTGSHAPNSFPDNVIPSGYMVQQDYREMNVRVFAADGYTGQKTIRLKVDPSKNDQYIKYIDYTFNVLDLPSTPTADFNVAPQYIAPQTMQIFEDRMVERGALMGTPENIGVPGNYASERHSWYYDGGHVFNQIAEYTGDAYWLNAADIAMEVNRDYVLGGGGTLAGWRQYSEQFYDDWMNQPAGSLSRELDETAVGYWAANANTIGIAKDPQVRVTNCRETALSIQANVIAARMGLAFDLAATKARVDAAIGHLDQWFVSKVLGPRGSHYIQPLYVALTSKALIEYYDWTVGQGTPDQRIPQAIRHAVDWLITPTGAVDPNTGLTAYQQYDPWRPTLNRWYNMLVYAGPTYEVRPDNIDLVGYYEGTTHIQIQGGTTATNNLIVPMLGWVYKMFGPDAGPGVNGIKYGEFADNAFHYGSLATIDDDNTGPKVFNQNHYWIFDYLNWRNNHDWADAAAPTISALQTTPVGAGAVAITWQSSEPATTEVEYGLTPGYGLLYSQQSATATKAAGMLVTGHRADLTGLVSGQTYYYRVSSTDPGGNVRTATGTFTPQASVGFTAPDGRIYFGGNYNDGVTNYMGLKTVVIDSAGNVVGAVEDHGTFGGDTLNNAGIAQGDLAYDQRPVTSGDYSATGYPSVGVSPELVTFNSSGYNAIAVASYWANGTYNVDRPASVQGSRYPVAGLLQITPTSSSANQAVVLGAGRAYTAGAGNTEGGSFFLYDPASDEFIGSYYGTSSGVRGSFTRIDNTGDTGNWTEAGDFASYTPLKRFSGTTDEEQDYELFNGSLYLTRGYQTVALVRYDSSFNPTTLSSDTHLGAYYDGAGRAIAAGSAFVNGQKRDVIYMITNRGSTDHRITRLCDADGNGVISYSATGDSDEWFDIVTSADTYKFFRNVAWTKKSPVLGSKLNEITDLEYVESDGNKYLFVANPTLDTVSILQLSADGRLANELLPELAVRVIQLPTGALKGTGYRLGAMEFDAAYTVNHVSVSAEGADATAGESGDTGRFAFTRTDTVGSLVVNFTVEGTAGAGDYLVSGQGIAWNGSTGSATFAPGVSTVYATITPQDDAVSESQETVTVTLANGGYTLLQNADTIVIDDNDFGGGPAVAPIGYWRFEGGTLNEFLSDSSGNSLNLANSPTDLGNAPLSKQVSNAYFPDPITQTNQANGKIFDSTGNYYLGTNDNALFSLSDFTIEAFVRPSGALQYSPIAGQWEVTNNNRGWLLNFSSSGQVGLYLGYGTSSSWAAASGLYLALDTNYYIGASVDTDTDISGTQGIRVTFHVTNLDTGAISVSEATTTAITSFNDVAEPFRIGSASGSAGIVNTHSKAYIDEVRLTGASLSEDQLLISAGGPPVVGYWRFEQGGFLDDSGTNGLSLSQSGSPLAQGDNTTTPYFPDPIAQSGAANTGYTSNSAGSSRWVERADETAFAFNDFTIESFVRLSNPAAGTGYTIASQYQPLNNQRSWNFRAAGSTATKTLGLTLGYGTSSTVYVDSGLQLTDAKSYYAAVAVNVEAGGTSVTFYCRNLTDGGALQTATFTPGTIAGLANVTSLIDATAPFRIGSYTSSTFQGGDVWKGYIDEVRLTETLLSENQLLVNNPDSGATSTVVMEAEDMYERV